MSKVLIITNDILNWEHVKSVDVRYFKAEDSSWGNLRGLMLGDITARQEGEDSTRLFRGTAANVSAAFESFAAFLRSETTGFDFRGIETGIEAYDTGKAA